AGGRSVAVREDMTQVRAAVGAAHLGAHRAQRLVLEVLDRVRAVLGLQRLVEARPPTTGVELGLRLEQLGLTRPTAVDTGRLRVGVLTDEGSLGSRLAQHLVLLGSQLCTPLLVGLLHLVSHGTSLLSRPTAP